jgi:hypothetical protein
MAEAPMCWTSIAATNAARGASCLPGFELELPESVPSMPNDLWTIFTCSPQRPRVKPGETPVTVDYRTRYTKVISVDRTREWTIPHTQFYWTNRPGALLTTYRWSVDGKYLYLLWHYYPGPDGGDATIYFSITEDVALFRLHLDTGIFESVLPYAEQSYAFSLSPDNRYLAYRNPDEQTAIRIREIDTNREIRKDLYGDYVLTGAFVWRADSQAVFFASAMKGWEEGKAGTSIFSIAVRDMTMRMLLYNDKRILIPFPCRDNRTLYSWSGDNYLCITSLDENSDAALQNFLLNVRTGEVVPAPTRTPTGPKTSTASPS